ncbi:MAG: MBL fold metallo-hydrolase [Streptosporangiales bacterium]|nr:MBL fold metallo-hydrolase [Streptosporangiales bacterium]
MRHFASKVQAVDGGAGVRQWRIGAVTVTKVVELEATGGFGFVLPQATRDALAGMDWLKPHFATDEGRAKTSVHALVVETPTRRIIVDTGLGNDKQGRAVPGWNGLNLPFLRDLSDAGYPPEMIDTVICTHLHVDHVGWNTRLDGGGRWVPTFPNARYLFVRQEFAHWRSVHEETPENERALVFADSVRPVDEAGLVDLVDDTHAVCEEVRLVATTGHTPGHVSVLISSEGKEALITGDFLHHPCQLARPDWAATPDWDQEMSTRTRREMFTWLADRGTLVIGTHFAEPSAGRVVRDGDAFRFAV